ncbi:unnamed protein product, partial [Darwinula stevensoni]
MPAKEEGVRRRERGGGATSKKAKTPKEVKAAKGSEKSKDKESPEKGEESRREVRSLLTGNRVFSRVVLIIGLLFVVYLGSSKKEVILASRKESISKKQDVPCSKDYDEDQKKFPDCVPKRCCRLVTDSAVTESEAEFLQKFAKTALSLGGGAGGVSILDLHSGALSNGTQFINFYKVPEAKKLLTKKVLSTYQLIKMKVQQLVETQFGLKPWSLHLTYPTFFSQMTNKNPTENPNDEYWHVHVDKEVYDDFHYTSLLYLSNYGDDFTGGRFMYIDQDGVNRTVRNTVIPFEGRVSIFTSGSENTHRVERVESGVRYALTIGFTCNLDSKISDPVLP